MLSAWAVVHLASVRWSRRAQGLCPGAAAVAAGHTAVESEPADLGEPSCRARRRMARALREPPQ
eukprot:11215366-Lingulodinium_polyedra.AAC.1